MGVLQMLCKESTVWPNAFSRRHLGFLPSFFFFYYFQTLGTKIIYNIYITNNIITSNSPDFYTCNVISELINILSHLSNENAKRSTF